MKTYQVELCVCHCRKISQQNKNTLHKRVSENRAYPEQLPLNGTWVWWWTSEFIAYLIRGQIHRYTIINPSLHNYSRHHLKLLGREKALNASLRLWEVALISTAGCGSQQCATLRQLPKVSGALIWLVVSIMGTLAHHKSECFFGNVVNYMIYKQQVNRWWFWIVLHVPSGNLT